MAILPPPLVPARLRGVPLSLALAQVRVGTVGLVETVFPLHHHTKVLVVEQQDLGLKLVNRNRGQLLCRGSLVHSYPYFNSR
jgi:hypothetical protein